METSRDAVINSISSLVFASCLFIYLHLADILDVHCSPIIKGFVDLLNLIIEKFVQAKCDLELVIITIMITKIRIYLLILHIINT